MWTPEGEFTGPATVLIDDDQIRQVAIGSPPPPDGPSQAFEHSVILPGLVNAHAHLEMTHVAASVGKKPEFTQWLRHLVQQLQKADEADPDARKKGAREGVRLSLESGTTTVCDITNTGVSLEKIRDTGMRGVVCFELLGFHPERAEEKMTEAIEWLGAHHGDSRVSAGLSPHAPYSVSSKLLQFSARLADEENRLVVIHVSETEEENRFLHTGKGIFKEHLEFYGAYDLDFVPPGVSSVRYLHQLNVLDRPCLLIHCNYLDDEEIQMIADSGSSVVYCPRSHFYFGHMSHPYPRLKEAGVNVAIGTDSLASNESLGILDEIRFLQDNGVVSDLTELVQLATVNGAKALRMEDTIGALKPGMKADLTVVRLPEGTTPDTGLLDPAAGIEAVIVDGVRIFPEND